jgi:hypothetical protein
MLAPHLPPPVLPAYPGPVRRRAAAGRERAPVRPARGMMCAIATEREEPEMSDVAWTGTPVRPHEGSRDNGAESLPWGGRGERLPLRPA